MKTFKLKSLKIVEKKNRDFFQKKIPLIDGLVINREDEQSRWLVEAYVTNEYLDYFKTLEKREGIMINVKISKETNDPATFITSIINITEIDQRLSILFMGTIIDRRQTNIEAMLKQLIEEGYEGKDLLERFKQLTVHKNEV
ncbi:MAG TPA: YwpF family protein [Virgibacillus sp.]|nr:YwpF family protein [Virgibacillus sp.]